MKEKFIYILIIFLYVSCNKSKPELMVKARLVHTYDSILSDNTIKKISKVDITLFNNTDKIISFWTMNCSWTDNWLINSNNNFRPHDCDNNFPIIVRIKPNDSTVYHSTITTQANNPLQIDSVRFGFIYIDTVICKTQHDFKTILSNRSKQNKIIWSNQLMLVKDSHQKFFINNILYTKNYLFPLLFIKSTPDISNTYLYSSLIKKYQMADSCLKISLEYGGGCEHAYIQIMADTSNASKGADIKLYFAFQDFDICKALLRYTFNIDLKDLRKKYPSNLIKCDFINNRKSFNFDNY